VRQDGAALEQLIAEGKDPTAFLSRLNDDYKRLNLTLGGIADMLGVAFGWLIFGEEIVPDAHGIIQKSSLPAKF
jgi:triphosphoribosyl-dephospho-CoA synthase